MILGRGFELTEPLFKLGFRLKADACFGFAVSMVPPMSMSWSFRLCLLKVAGVFANGLRIVARLGWLAADLSLLTKVGVLTV